uniref:Uncharacterized protein n=1 Tax=Palpitomonas bilix TaxID=652834 RepID=A0A7S3D7M5_9EUKA|mmetsp:Transcript_25869/g.65482  ORF Transcript_25869/g.65482 Transcript_25869/m.65482 type:complete len:160 (+) Transcript_25869:171-650(+)
MKIEGRNGKGRRKGERRERRDRQGRKSSEKGGDGVDKVEARRGEEEESKVESSLQSHIQERVGGEGVAEPAVGEQQSGKKGKKKKTVVSLHDFFAKSDEDEAREGQQKAMPAWSRQQGGGGHVSLLSIQAQQAGEADRRKEVVRTAADSAWSHNGGWGR